MIILLLNARGKIFFACNNVHTAIESFKKSCSYPEFVECKDIQNHTGFPHIEVYESGLFVGAISGVKLVDVPQVVHITYQ